MYYYLHILFFYMLYVAFCCTFSVLIIMFTFYFYLVGNGMDIYDELHDQGKISGLYCFIRIIACLYKHVFC